MGSGEEAEEEDGEEGDGGVGVEDRSGVSVGWRGEGGEGEA